MAERIRNRGKTGWKKALLFVGATLAVAAAALAAAALAEGAGWRIVGWNNLGMHCMDADFGVFAILPPYNTVEAQVIDGSGRLVRSGAGLTVTYEAIADPSGSRNSTSSAKTNFWQNVANLFGVSLPVDAGLKGNDMPGPNNVPRPMTFDSGLDAFVAEGIPITPYDDNHQKNFYPMVRLTVRDGTGTLLTSTDVVLPVSDEMDCRSCHASGSGPAARPASGWVSDPDPQRDFRLNVLRLHDDRFLGNPTYQAALAAIGYRATGLYPTATAGRSILCASCHLSEALPGTGFAGVPPLTASMHAGHASVQDPTNGMTLDSASNRSACYRCHPGSTTKCLRGTMGNAVAADGSMAMQCQSCHGSMSTVGASTRTGWLQEPSCQQCHSGTAIHNNGAIRYTSVFDSTGAPRVAVDSTFATNSNAPAAGLSLYRFSAGHGGLQCEACHGSTHAEYPSSHANDNVQNIALQGHAGVLAECSVCHSGGVSTSNGGPHGMHPVGSGWVSSHHDAIPSGGVATCRTCHGADYRGTVLSRSSADRTISTDFGTKSFWRGFQIGCYTCHNGPNSESSNPNRPPSVLDSTASTPFGTPVALLLRASDLDGNALTLRVVGQPSGGTVGLSGTTATYFPGEGFSGSDSFTYAANDGMTDSNLGRVTVSVQGAACVLSCTAKAPSSAKAGTAVSFDGGATATSCSTAPTFSWTFGDGATSSSQNPTHSYGSPGSYSWSLIVQDDGASCTKGGVIAVTSTNPPPTISGISPLYQPFRLQITGTGFQASVKVVIGSDSSPWPFASVIDAQHIVVGGGGLLAKFPKGVPVPIRVVNHDGQSASAVFTR